MYLNARGLVLREVNYKEADKILTVLTDAYGKLTVKASACRRKNSRLMGAAQLLCFSEMVLFERQGRISLKEASPVQQFVGLRADFLRLALASYFAELTQTVTQEGMAQPTILSLLLNALYALDTLGKEPRLCKAAFELALLCDSGYEPRLEGCAVCGQADPAAPRLHLRAGLLHCATCRDRLEEGISMPLSPAALQALRHIAWGDSKRLFSFRLDEESMQILSNVCEAFLQTQLERGFRTLDFYKQYDREDIP